MNIEDIRDIDTGLGKLADLCGIEYQSEPQVKVDMLKAMGVLDDTFCYQVDRTDEQAENLRLVKSLIKEILDAEYINIAQNVSVLRQNRVNTVEISIPDGVQSLKWNFYEDENIRKYYAGTLQFDDSSKVYSGEISVEELEPVKDSVHNVDGTVYRKYRFKFPFDVHLGYHDVQFFYVDSKGGERTQKTLLISAPEKCYDRLGIKDGNKTWGVPVQLYELQSENNIGIGNYSDLAQTAFILGKSGAGLIGVNPLHANWNDFPESASPYSPDCRMFFNYIYLDVTAIEEFKKYTEIKDYYNSPAVQEKISRNRRKSFVDYTATQELVDDILMRCFEKFKLSPNNEDRNLFDVFCDNQGEILEKFAIFHALSRDFSKKNPRPLNWTQWPEEYRNPNSEAIQRFKKTHQKEIEFFKYAQYQCSKQLAEVKETCLNAGMKIGLYTDMAVGASTKGFEAWCNPDIFIKGSAGATPDELSPTGQVWNLLGFNPRKLKENRYEPYRRILEMNMQYAGCMRIDHVLQLNRLYFYPETGGKGTYIYYNSEELMGIVALESHIHKTMIIGEDIGATTEEFRRKLADYGILSYNVLPFEREWDVYNSMKRPENYPQLSVCATSTHDTPTLINQWDVRNVWMLKTMGCFSQEIIDRMFDQYASQRESINWMLEHYGCWNEVGGHKSEHPREEANFIPEKYIQAVTAFLARSNSAVMMMPFSDIFGVGEMGNIPGVSEMPAYDSNILMDVEKSDKYSYPNWRKKLHIPIEHFENVALFKDVIEILNRYRSNGNDGRGRYYQFERLGDNRSSKVDFSRALHLYQINRNRSDYQLSQLLINRYGGSFRLRLAQRKEAIIENYTEAVRAYYESKRGKVS